MTNEELVNKVIYFVKNSPDNHVSEQDAIYPKLAGLKLYETPIIGFAFANDELFTKEYKKEGVIHPEHMAPKEWLPSAKTVISFFMPFTKEVKESNRYKSDEPYASGISQRCSVEWLHARVERQFFLDKITDYIQTLLEN